MRDRKRYIIEKKMLQIGGSTYTTTTTAAASTRLPTHTRWGNCIALLFAMCFIVHIRQTVNKYRLDKNVSSIVLGRHLHVCRPSWGRVSLALHLWRLHSEGNCLSQLLYKTIDNCLVKPFSLTPTYHNSHRCLPIPFTAVLLWGVFILFTEFYSGKEWS